MSSATPPSNTPPLWQPAVDSASFAANRTACALNSSAFHENYAAFAANSSAFRVNYAAFAANSSAFHENYAAFAANSSAFHENYAAFAVNSSAYGENSPVSDVDSSTSREKASGPALCSNFAGLINLTFGEIWTSFFRFPSFFCLSIPLCVNASLCGPLCHRKLASPVLFAGENP